MQVRFLRDTVYEPAPDDSIRCFGQLRKRASLIETPQADGTTKILPGPMQHYFKMGTTPELKDHVARGFIATGQAEAIDGPVVIFLTPDEVRAAKQEMKL